MAKRMIVMLAVTLAIVAALGFVKFKQIQTAIGQAAAFQPPPEAVTTIVAQEQQWPSTLSAIGTMAASVAGHSSRAATIVVTASGGGCMAANWAPIAWNCRNFTKPSVPMKAIISTSIKIIRFHICPSPTN